MLKKRQGLLVRDHALVGALHFVHGNNVDIRTRTLLEAGTNCHSVEEVGVQSGTRLADLWHCSLIVGHDLFYYNL